MILMNCNQFLQGAGSIREIFIQMCDAQLIKLMKDNSLGLLQILEKYDISDIKRAFRQIYVNGNYLAAPERTETSKILRYLEYGGENIRPTHLLSSVKRLIIDTFSTERR